MSKKESKILTVEELPGVGSATAEKWKDAGFDSLLSIAVSSPSVLSEAAGVGEPVARKMIQTARNSLDMGFESGDELLERRAKVIKITTGSKTFDGILGGGVETGGITECYGEFGCITPDTRITLSDGRAIPIGDFAGDKKAGVYPINLGIITKKGNELIKTTAKNLFVYDCSHVFKVITRDSREICVTANHPLMTQRGWVNASDLTTEDVLCIENDNIFPEDYVKLSTFDANNNTRIKVDLPKELTPKFARYLGYILGEGWKETNPHLTNTGNVYRVSYASKTKDLLEDWKSIVNEIFGIDSNFRRIDKTSTETWAIDSVMVGEYLRQFEGLYNLANYKYIPQQIFESPKEVVTEFLSSLYDSEGCCSLDMTMRSRTHIRTGANGQMLSYEYELPNYGRNIQLASASFKLVKDLQLLLTKLGIDSWMNKYISKKASKITGENFVKYTLNITKEEAIKEFYEAIGCKTLRLKEKILKTINSYKRHMNGSINYNKIKEIQIIQNPYGKVYDIEVPETHNFIANGILSHNSGKSSLAHQLAVTVQLPKEKGGADGACVWIDTESTFRPERIKQIATGLGLDPQEILKNIKVARAFNSDHQMLLVDKVEDLIKNEKIPIKLVIVDSLMSHFRSDFVGRGTLADRQQKINKHMHALLKLADTYGICVYVTNQVMSKPDMFFGDPTTAIGGHIVAHNSTVRCYLRKGKKGTRVAKVVDAPHLPESEAIFQVTEGGIVDVKE